MFKRAECLLFAYAVWAPCNGSRDRYYSYDEILGDARPRADRRLAQNSVRQFALTAAASWFNLGKKEHTNCIELHYNAKPTKKYDENVDVLADGWSSRGGRRQVILRAGSWPSSNIKRVANAMYIEIY
ncbi:unnamed protein product [Trichogramma brassicae]|uniref:Uncharacterized protein n=1 Tax=Trichogramma brassicae TaxID=86971 RepID=A0A6H5ICG0_9HYME|nr:unnamed protein product [Trichogramma brassicae]